jgi:hypothetical protein
MAGVGDLDFHRVLYRWVVDRGIKVYGRRMLLNMLDIPWHTTYSAPQRQP